MALTLIFQGHHERKWSKKGADKDLNSYFDSLNSEVHNPLKQATAHKWHQRVGDEMDEYLSDLEVCPAPCHHSPIPLPPLPSPLFPLFLSPALHCPFSELAHCPYFSRSYFVYMRRET